MLREGHTPFDSAWFYCVSSAIYFPIFSLGLFVSNAYLHAGTNSYTIVFVFLMIAELIKYAYIQLVSHKDIPYTPKQGYKLVNIALYLIKQIRFLQLVRSVLVLTACTCIVFVIAVFFGAEVLSHHEETLMFSCLIVILTAFPVCLHQGIVSLMQFLNGIYPSDPFTKVLLRNIQFTMLGGWFGAFVIPLDWDREWQVWPIPCSLGAMIGYGASQVFSIVEFSVKFRAGTLPKIINKNR